MKYAIISDIHSNLIALKLAIDDATKKGVNHFIFLGDLITDGFCDNEVLDLIKGKNSLVIKGNRERYILNIDENKFNYINFKPIKYTINNLSKENYDYINNMNDELLVEIENKKILITHGDSFNLNDNMEFNYNKLIDNYDFDICFFGHTHSYVSTKYKNKLFINPGSIGQPADGNSYKYVIFNFNNSNSELVEFTVEETYMPLVNEYKNSMYYKENFEWSNLILLCTRDGVDHITPFFSLINKLDFDKDNYEIFNTEFKNIFKKYIESLNFSLEEE